MSWMSGDGYNPDNPPKAFQLYSQVVWVWQVCVSKHKSSYICLCKTFCYSYYSCSTVPSPTVVIDFATPGAVTYAGNNVTLNCAISLLGGVTDSDVTVNNRWTKDGAPFTGVSGRVTLTPFTRITSISYLSRLIFSPLSSSMDNGTYLCITILTPRQPQFVTGNSASASFTLAVRGEIT